MLLTNFIYIMEKRLNRGNKNPNQGVQGITAINIAKKRAERLQRQKEVRENKY